MKAALLHGFKPPLQLIRLTPRMALGPSDQDGAQRNDNDKSREPELQGGLHAGGKPLVIEGRLLVMFSLTIVVVLS
jgi:hypothetical protein